MDTENTLKTNKKQVNRTRRNDSHRLKLVGMNFLKLISQSVSNRNKHTDLHSQ